MNCAGKKNMLTCSRPGQGPFHRAESSLWPGQKAARAREPSANTTCFLHSRARPPLSKPDASTSTPRREKHTDHTSWWRLKLHNQEMLSSLVKSVGRARGNILVVMCKHIFVGWGKILFTISAIAIMFDCISGIHAVL